jgi:hypothetical protein
MRTRSEQLDREVHPVRARLAETFEQLCAGMTSGQLVDQLAGLRARAPGSRVLPQPRTRNSGNPAPADWSPAPRGCHSG